MTLPDVIARAAQVLTIEADQIAEIHDFLGNQRFPGFDLPLSL